MHIQELNYNKDKDILLISCPREYNINEMERIKNAIQETFINNRNGALIITDDITVSIFHTPFNLKKEEDFPFS